MSAISFLQVLVSAVVTIKAGATLNITAGTEIGMQTGATIIVEGTLYINGADNNTVLITSAAEGVRIPEFC
jgi:hypothetical protein